MRFTAIVLSARPVTLEIPGVTVLGRVQTVTTAAQMNAARLDALAAVQTPYCFFLDDDDALPADYLDVLQACAAAGKPLAYTDELVRGPTGEFVNKGAPYDRARHAANALFVHHLALMDTRAAQAAAAQCPRGDYWPEMTLYFKLAEGGATYLPRIGYIWNKAGGMHTWPGTLIAQVASMTWAHRELTA